MLDIDRVQSMPLVEIRADGRRYTANQISSALPSSARRSSRSQPTERNDKDDKAHAVGAGAVLLQHEDEIRRTVEDLSAGEPRLWAGDWENIIDLFSGKSMYPSQSEADFDLARSVARRFSAKGLAGDELQTVVKAIFEQSGLAARDKWQNRPDYRRRTITSACEDLTPSQEAENASDPEATTGVDWTLHSDIRNARFFASRYRAKLFYERGSSRWYRWTDERWEVCSKGEEIEAAKDAAVLLTTMAAKVAATEPEKGSKLIRQCAEAHREPRIAAMLKLAKSEPGMSATTTELDADPRHLGVRNGVVDLRTGHLLRNSPERLITRYCATDFQPGANAAQWLRFLDDVFEGDSDTIDAVRRLIGLTLTGVTHEEVLIFAVGSGANGKSIFSNVLARILADYALMAPSTLLAARRTDDTGPRSDLAMLAGARLVSINELPGGMTLDETVAKQLAGREPITARFLHREFFTYQPRFTPWVRTNHRPIIKGADEGIWRRLQVIRFGRSFGPDEADPHLEEKLWSERVGILNWMIEGAGQYLSDGLKMSSAMRQEINSYRSASDVLGEFLSEKTDADVAAEVPQGDLFLGWRHWCEYNGYRPGAKASFTERLIERGYGKRKSGSKRYYTGLEQKGYGS